MKKSAYPKQLKTFSIALPVLLLLFACRHYFKTGLDFWVPICVALAVVSIILSVFFKGIFEQFFSGWMKVAGLIGVCVTAVLLSIIYFVVFTPAALVLRLCGKDSMNKHFNNQAPSYWIKCTNELNPKESYLQQF